MGGCIVCVYGNTADGRSNDRITGAWRIAYNVFDWIFNAVLWDRAYNYR